MNRESIFTNKNNFLDDTLSKTNYRVACIIGAILSTLCCIILVFSFKSNKSIHARLMKYISLGEAIYIYSQLIICLNLEFENVENTFCLIVDALVFKYSSEAHLSCSIINTINKCLFYSMQAFFLPNKLHLYALKRFGVFVIQFQKSQKDLHGTNFPH